MHWLLENFVLLVMRIVVLGSFFNQVLCFCHQVLMGTAVWEQCSLGVLLRLLLLMVLTMSLMAPMAPMANMHMVLTCHMENSSSTGTVSSSMESMARCEKIPLSDSS